MTQPKPIPEPEMPTPHAKGDFVQDRALGANAGAKKGWRNRCPLESYYERGMLNGGREPALNRFAAGDEYRRRYKEVEPSGKDSTQVEKVMSSHRGDYSILDKAEKSKWLLAVDSHLGRNDRHIIRKVCGDDLWPSEVIGDICGPAYRKAIAPRFCEALDNLIYAMETVRRDGVKFNIGRSV